MHTLFYFLTYTVIFLKILNTRSGLYDEKKKLNFINCKNFRFFFLVDYVEFSKICRRAIYNINEEYRKKI